MVNALAMCSMGLRKRGRESLHIILCHRTRLARTRLARTRLAILVAPYFPPKTPCPPTSAPTCLKRL